MKTAHQPIIKAAMVAVLCSFFLLAADTVRSQSGPPMPPTIFLDYYSFLQTNFDSDYGYAPIGESNVFSVADWGGNALWLDTTNESPAYIHYHLVETNGQVNIQLGTGAILALVTPDWASADTNQLGHGPGARGYLLASGDFSGGSPEGLWAIYVDAGGTNIYFGGVSNSVTNTYVSAPISWATNSLHMIGVYYQTNTELYLDGQRAATGGPVTIVPATNTWTNGFYVGSEASGYDQFRGIFLYLEMDTTNVFLVSTNYLTWDWSWYTNQYYTWLDGSGGEGGFHPDGSGGFGFPPPPTNTYNSNFLAYTNFWLSITNTGDAAQVDLINPCRGLTYVIFTNSQVQPLTSTNWQPWVIMVGSNTVMSAPSITPTSNTLFFCAELIWETGTNSLPDWWQLMYFNTLNVNPYADPDGDGLCNLDEYLLGLNPTNAHTLSSAHTDAQAEVLAYTNSTGCVYHLAITNGPNTNTLLVTMSPTVVGTNYQIYSQTCSNCAWIVETNFLGTNTSTTVAICLNGRTLSLIGGYGEDSDGDLLPDGYEVLATHTDPYLPDTGLTGTPDTYKDPDGDGYLNIEEYYNNTDPLVWNPPPGPANFTVVYGTNGTSATLTWASSFGSVSNFTILVQNNASGLGFVPLTNVPSSQHSFIDTNSDFSDGIEYEMEANYEQGSSLLEDANPPPTSPLGACLVPGTNGALYLALLTVPAGTTAILLELAPNYSCGWGNGTNQSETIPTNYFTNGMYPLSAEQYPYYTAYTVSALAVNAASTNFVPVVIESDCQRSIRYPFLDGSQVLKDNMVFNLQAQSAIPATDTGLNAVSVQDFEGLGLSQDDPTMPIYAVGSYRSTISSAPFYFDFAAGLLFQPEAEPLHPWEINAVMRGFIYNLGPADCGFTNGGPGGAGSGSSAGWTIVNTGGGFGFDTAAFATSNSTNPCPSMIGSPTNRAINNLDPMMPIEGDAATMPDAPNAFGLSNQGSYLEYQASLTNEAVTSLLSPGSSATNYFGLYGWEQYQAPEVEAQFYQFTPAGNLGAIAPDQAITNAPVTNVLIATVADPNFGVSGWMRYHLLNGYAGIYGYVEQYFDKAYLMTNGTITTNQTGVLSPYGYFFPTQPGQVALTTRTNIDTGSAGTAIVNVIRLSLDVNHDGTMDETFAGPDNTSPNMPYVFWANNDYDRYNEGTEEDLQSAAEPDYNYTIAGNRAIPCPRDLEDFARLWVSGVSNVLTNLPAGTSVVLSWQNNSGASIDVFQAADVDGGIGYLTNLTTASNQINTNLCRYVGWVGPDSGIVLNDGSYSNGWAGDHYIFCGVTPGIDQLNLFIYDTNFNVLAESSQYIEIKDIKQMYERWTVGDSPKTAPGAPMNEATNALDNFSPGMPQTPFVYPADPITNDDYIVFVHGWNMPTWEKDRFAETAYKRLYWQGYQGRFGSFRWPCNLLNLTHPAGYNIGEWTAWQTGQPFETFLAGLNSKYPGNVYILAHSMGNVVTGEALKLAGTNVIVNTYVATQAAISARAYGTNVPQDVTYTPLRPDSEGHYYTNGAPPYFNGIGGAGTFMDYYNQSDYALHYWVTDQSLKPDSFSYHYATPTSQFPSGYYYAPPFRIARSLIFPTNTYEIFARAAQSYSFALGAETNIAARFSTNTPVNLNSSTYNFGPLRTGHSLQFYSDNMSVGTYWSQLLLSFDLK